MPVASHQPRIEVPYFRPSITEAEIAEVVACLRSGWLTTGPRCKQFETAFAEQTGAKHAVAVNSCTAALHLAVDALGLGPGQAVLVPTMTFAATAEVVRYQNAVPLLVDCDPVTLNMDLARRPAEDRAIARRPNALGSGAPRGGHHARTRGRSDDGHGRGASVGRRARLVGRRGRGAQLSRRVSPPDAVRVLAGNGIERRGGAAARTPPPSPASPSTPTRPSPPAKAAWP